MKYPSADIAELYSHRWKIELGSREMKQYMLQNQLTLISKKPELVNQELWGMLVSYNLLQFMMCQMAYHQKSVMSIKSVLNKLHCSLLDSFNYYQQSHQGESQKY